MLPDATLGRFRFLSALVLPALLLAAAGTAPWLAPAGPPVIDAGDLAANPEARRGCEVVVTGQCLATAPCKQGYMVAALRGRDGGLVTCHFEDVPEADRIGLEGSLHRPGAVAVRGRCDGAVDGRAVLRGCRLLD